MRAQYNRILVPLDGSDFATQALHHAQAVAQPYGGTLELLRVVPNLEESVGMSLEFSHVQVDDWQQHLVEEATGALTEERERLSALGLTANIHVQEGSPAEKIVAFAEEHHIDLIVMSTHGRSGVARWVYGSVANKVLHQAPCPILLIRSEGM